MYIAAPHPYAIFSYLVIFWGKMSIEQMQSEQKMQSHAANNNRDVLPETWLQTAPSVVKHAN